MRTLSSEWGLPDVQTPFFLLDPEVVAREVERFRDFIPGVLIRYPVKCNPHVAVLETVRSSGGGFEVASPAELEQVLAIGAVPSEVLYSAPVKSAAAVSHAYSLGVRDFVADSADEIDKLAVYAPGCRLYLRIAVDNPTSIISLGSKFGVPIEGAPGLLRHAQAAGLQTEAVMFHVGSQTTDVRAWADALEAVMRMLTDQDGVDCPLVDIGGGFPHRYVDAVPTLEEIGSTIDAALERGSTPPRLVVEPGRALVAGCAKLVVSVVARVNRGSEEWLFLDAGIYHGLSEAALPGHPLAYPISLADREPEGDGLSTFTLTGPTCDSLDVIARGVALPECIRADDRLVIASAGAYSQCLSTSFNGFPPPAVVLR